MKQRKEFRAFGLNFVFGGMLTGGNYEANFGTDRRKAREKTSMGSAGRRSFRTQTDFQPAVRLTNENYTEIHLEDQFVPLDPLRKISR